MFGLFKIWLAKIDVGKSSIFFVLHDQDSMSHRLINAECFSKFGWKIQSVEYTSDSLFYSSIKRCGVNFTKNSLIAQTKKNLFRH